MVAVAVADQGPQSSLYVTPSPIALILSSYAPQAMSSAVPFDVQVAASSTYSHSSDGPKVPDDEYRPPNFHFPIPLIRVTSTRRSSWSRTVMLRLGAGGSGSDEVLDAPRGPVCPSSSVVVAFSKSSSSENGGEVSCTLMLRLANSCPPRVSILTVATPTGRTLSIQRRQAARTGPEATAGRGLRRPHRNRAREVR